VCIDQTHYNVRELLLLFLVPAVFASFVFFPTARVLGVWFPLQLSIVTVVFVSHSLDSLMVWALPIVLMIVVAVVAMEASS
jgi:hypothetical protein